MKDGELAILRPAIDHVIVGIAEEKIAVALFAARHPDRPFGKQKSSGQFLDLRAGWNNLIQRWIFLCDLRRGFADRNFRRLVEVKRCRLDPDEVLRAVRNRPVDAEDRKLNALAGLRVSREDYAIGGVESLDHRSARLPQHPGHLAVDPDLGIIIDHDFKSDG